MSKQTYTVVAGHVRFGDKAGRVRDLTAGDELELDDEIDLDTITTLTENDTIEPKSDRKKRLDPETAASRAIRNANAEEMLAQQGSGHGAQSSAERRANQRSLSALEGGASPDEASPVQATGAKGRGSAPAS